MSRYVVVLNDLSDAIYEKVDKALAKAPQFKDKREEIYQQMLGYYDRHGTVPDFDIEPRTPDPKTGGQ